MKVVNVQTAQNHCVFTTIFPTKKNAIFFVKWKWSMCKQTETAQNCCVFTNLFRQIKTPIFPTENSKIPFWIGQILSDNLSKVDIIKAVIDDVISP